MINTTIQTYEDYTNMLKNALIILLFVGHMTKTFANNFTTEQQLVSRYAGEITSFWQKGTFSHFRGMNNIRINYATFVHDNEQGNTELDAITNINNRKCLIISSGRSEGYLKYKELSFDLFNLGYNIFLIDHRGQGISERLLANGHKGYVDNFEFYVNDFAYFIEKIVTPNCTLNGIYNKPYLLAHSMGSAIAARYLQEYPESIQAAVLSSPMFGFNSGGIPEVIAKPLIQASNTLNQWIDDEPWYFLGQHDYSENDFDGNPLMHSALRFQQFGQLYQDSPELQLGGVTVKWLAESLIALETLFAKIDQIKTPTFVIQAGNDKIVSNQAQDDFCLQLHQLHPQSCPDGKPFVIDNAYHELFFEQDIYRQQALAAAVKWFESH